MSELKLILKKLDQISNRLDLLEKKIEKPELKKSTPETPPKKVVEWRISQELMNREKDDSDWESNIDEYIQNYQTDVGNLQGRIRRHQDDVQELRGKTVELFKFGHTLREKIIELDRKDLQSRKNRISPGKNTTARSVR
jgi:hypothetical protein